MESKEVRFFPIPTPRQCMSKSERCSLDPPHAVFVC